MLAFFSIFAVFPEMALTYKKTITKYTMKKNLYFISRWSIPVAGFLFTLMVGTAYAWSAFINPMTERFGWTKTEANIPFLVFIFMSAVMTIPAGKLQDRIGPRKTGLLAAALFFIAYTLASFVGHFPHTWYLILTYGLLGGTAGGIGYACAIPPARKWLPDFPGFAMAISVTGMGLSAVVWAPLKAKILIPDFGIEQTFFIIAIITSTVTVFASWLTRNPPQGWKPKNWSPESCTKKSTIILSESTPGEMLRTPKFWYIWSIFTLILFGGFVCLTLIIPYGIQEVKLTPVSAAFALSIFAFFNGFGRPLAGFLGDRFGALQVLIFTYVLQSATFFLFPMFATSQIVLYVFSGFLGWGFAASMALFPSITASNFGTKNLGMNYGIVYTAFGTGAIASLLGSWMYDTTGSYTPAFITGGTLATLGLLLGIILKKKYAVR
jgi:MFS transporter, OFA family, oxalate/formate antiporter